MAVSDQNEITLERLQTLQAAFPRQPELLILLGYTVSSTTRDALTVQLGIEKREANPLLPMPLGALRFEIDETLSFGELRPIIDWKIAAEFPAALQPYLKPFENHL
jgi:hypothetical protein